MKNLPHLSRQRYSECYFSERDTKGLERPALEYLLLAHYFKSEDFYIKC